MICKLALGLFLAVAGHADEVDDDELIVGQVVTVYGHRPGASTESLEGGMLDSIRASGGLKEALEATSGLDVQGLSGSKSFGKLAIRGADPKHTVVILNGQKLSQDFDLGSIPTEDLESVEILKGPEALAYSPEALGGVLLITTRSSDGKRGAWSFGASLGAFETSQAQLSTPDLRLGPYSGSLSLHAFDTAGYTLNTDERSLELEQSSSLSLGQEDLNLKAGYLERKGGIPLVKSIAANGTGDVDADDREERQAFDLSLVDESRLGAWDFDPGLDYSFVRARRLNPFDDDAQAGLSTDNTDTGLHWGLRLPLRRRWEGLLLNLDTAASQESLESGLSGWHGRDQGSFNLRTRTKAYPWLSVDLSGGVDSVTGFPVEFLPSGALNFEPVPGRRLSLSAGMGRRVPQLDQLYRAPLAFTALADPAFGAGEKGDPDLLPERSLKTQAALDLRGRDFSLNLAGFYDSLTDLIDYQLDPADNYWTYGNLGQARVYGGEGSLSAHLGNFSPFANYTYVDSRSQTGDLILGRLRQKISYGCGWQVLDRLELHAEHQYFEHNGPTSPYWWLNAGISASLTGGGKVFINGSNILDQVSDLMPGLPLRGRYFEVGTKFEF